MVSIKNATLKDAAIIAEIGRISFIESHGHSASAADIDSYVARKYTQEALKEELEDRNNIYHLIYYNGQPAGYSKIVLNTINENIPTQNITTLDRLYLLKEFYGLKLGLQLLEYNIAISKRSGQAGMWLYTWTENKRAVAFYQKIGFKISGHAHFRISETHANPNHVMYLEYANATSAE